MDYYEDTIQQDIVSKNQISYALLAGYEHKTFTLGAEYNNSYNFKFAEGKDMSGYSLYTTVPIYKEFSIYGRYDKLKAVGDWQSEKEGDMIILGFDYQPIKQILISPNFQSWKGVNYKRENYLLLSFQFKI